MSADANTDAEDLLTRFVNKAMDEPLQVLLPLVMLVVTAIVFYATSGFGQKKVGSKERRGGPIKIGQASPAAPVAMETASASLTSEEFSAGFMDSNSNVCKSESADGVTCRHRTSGGLVEIVAKQVQLTGDFNEAKEDNLDTNGTKSTTEIRDNLSAVDDNTIITNRDQLLQSSASDNNTNNNNTTISNVEMKQQTDPEPEDLSCRWRSCLLCLSEKMNSIGLSCAPLADLALRLGEDGRSCDSHSVTGHRGGEQTEDGQTVDKSDHSKPVRVSETVVTILSLGQWLVDEHDRRRRAEEWSDLLTLELDAQISARTNAEERQKELRTRAMEVVSKYKKLKCDYDTIMSQINELTQQDVAENRPKRENRSVTVLRRRYKKTADREAMKAKRKAFIASSYQDSPSSENDNEETERMFSAAAAVTKSTVPNRKEANETLTPRNETHTEVEGKECGISSSELRASRNGLTEQIIERLSASSNPSSEGGHTLMANTKEGHETSGKAEKDDLEVEINVKAKANMWEEMAQRIPFEVMTSTQHREVNETSAAGKTKHTRIVDAEAFRKCLRERPKTGLEDKEDGDTRDVEDEDDLSFTDDDTSGDDVLAERLNTKQKLQMWESLSSSNLANSGSDTSVTCSAASTSATSRHKCTLPVDRLVRFSNLKSQWEEKGKSQNQ